MKEITEKETKEIIDKEKDELRQIIEDGGKITKTTIEEKDKITVITKIEPVEGKSTSSKIVQAKNKIIINP